MQTSVDLQQVLITEFMGLLRREYFARVPDPLVLR